MAVTINLMNEKQQKQITWIGLIANIILAIIKYFLGVWGQSQALIADAFHSVSDLVTDISILMGIRYWNAPPDDNHAYGHHKVEAFVTLFIGLILLGTAIAIGYQATILLIEQQFHKPRAIAIYGAVISILLKEGLYQWTRHIGQQTKSQALIANAWHHRSDALSSIPVLITVSLASIWPKLNYLDQIGAILVSLFIINTAWKIIAPTFLELTDGGSSIELRNEIRSISMQVTGVKAVHAIRNRKVGTNHFVDLHIMVDPEISVRLGHEIARTVKRKLQENSPDIGDVIVHLEPFE